MGTILTYVEPTTRIKDCHVNVWTLPAFLGEIHYLDVGLRLENAAETPLAHVDIGIPLVPRPEDTECLISKVKDLSSWRLIFPDATHLTQGGAGHVNQSLKRAEFGDMPMSSVSIAMREALDQFSVWRLTLDEPLPPGQATYLRVRFAIREDRKRKLACVRHSNDLAVFERVRTYDLRVNETREQVQLPEQIRRFPTPPRMDVLRIFLIVADRYSPRVINPQPKHIRLLEGRAWQDYLGRRLAPFGIGGTPKLVIYSWKAEVPAGEEYRAFASLHRDLGRFDVPTFFVAVVVAIVAIVAASPPWAGDLWSDIRTEAGQNLAAIGVVAALLLLTVCTLAFSATVRTLRSAVLRTVDDLLYGLRLSK